MHIIRCRAGIGPEVGPPALLIPHLRHHYEEIMNIIKVKVQVYSLISSLKTYHPTLHLTPWSLDLFIRVPLQLHGEHTVQQPFRRIELIVHIAISVLPGTHFHLSQVKHLKVKCLAQAHNILTMSQDLGGKYDICLKILHQAGLETARQAATSAERHALTIAPCPMR